MKFSQADVFFSESEKKTNTRFSSPVMMFLTRSSLFDLWVDLSVTNALCMCPFPNYEAIVSLKQKLLAWMRGGSGDFEAAALEVFRYQFGLNLAYRNYCDALGRTPENVGRWQEIPAVPTDVFKLTQTAMRCFPRDDVKGFFLTSGTTREVRGKHEFLDLELYEASVKGCWRELGLPQIRKPWFFSQGVEDAPHSSLVRMFEILNEDGEWLMDAEGRLLPGKFSPNEAASILGTSLALWRFCEESEPVKLAEGSWIFETGGSKGLRESHSPSEVRQRLSGHFSLPESRILNEYGMTELFSQFYKWGDAETHQGPAWTAIRVVDVFSGNPAAAGEVGYLEIMDLANLDTVSAIRTQDLAIATGERSFILIGRDPSAAARGCSRGVDAVLTV